MFWKNHSLACVRDYLLFFVAHTISIFLGKSPPWAFYTVSVDHWDLDHLNKANKFPSFVVIVSVVHAIILSHFFLPFEFPTTGGRNGNVLSNSIDKPICLNSLYSPYATMHTKTHFAIHVDIIPTWVDLPCIALVCRCRMIIYVLFLCATLFSPMIISVYCFCDKYCVSI